MIQSYACGAHSTCFDDNLVVFVFMIYRITYAGVYPSFFMHTFNCRLNNNKNMYRNLQHFGYISCHALMPQPHYFVELTPEAENIFDDVQQRSCVVIN